MNEPDFQALYDEFIRLDPTRQNLLRRAINPEDLNLMQVCDQPRQVVDAIFAHYEARGFEPSAAEQEIMLDL